MNIAHYIQWWDYVREMIDIKCYKCKKEIYKRLFGKRLCKECLGG